MERLISAFILFALFVIEGIGQTITSDEVIHSKVIYFSNVQSDSVLFYAKQLQNSKDFSRSMFGYHHEATVLYNQWEYERCEAILNYILSQIDDQTITDSCSASFNYSELMVGETFEEVMNIVRLNVYRRFFYLRLNQNRFDDAFDYLDLRQYCIKALKERDTYYFRNLISLELSRAALNSRVGNYEESLRILNDIKVKINHVNLPDSDPYQNYFRLEKAYILNDLARNYELLIPKRPEYIDSVEVYTDLTYQTTKTLKNREEENRRAHLIRKCKISLLKNEYERALQYLEMAEELIPSSGNSEYALFLKAKCYIGLNQNDSAIYFTQELLSSNTNGALPKVYETNAYDILAKSYYHMGQLDSAYKYSGKTISEYRSEVFEKNSIQERLSERKVERVESMYTLLNRKSNKKWYQVLVAILFVSILITIGLAVRSSKRKVYIQSTVDPKGEYEPSRRTIGDRTETVKRIDDELLNRILTELDEIEKSGVYLDHHFTLATLSRLLQTNTSYLSKIINEHKGKSFSQYLVSLRIDYLKQQLEDNSEVRKYSIEALGELIGYTNASSFARAFKKHVGVSPSKYLRTNYPEEFFGTV